MSIPPPTIRLPDPATRWGPEAFARAAWRHKFITTVGILVGLATGAALAHYLPPVYQSSAQISIVRKRPDLVTGLDTRQMASEEYISPPQDLLKSSPIVENAMLKAGLANLPSFARSDVDPAEQIRNSLVVAPSKGPAGQSLAFKMSCRAADADDCRTVLVAVLDSFREFMDKKHQSVSSDTIELILREKRTLEKEIAEKESAYRAFRETAPLLGKGKDILELRQERLTSIQAKRSSILLQKVELEGQLVALEAAFKAGPSQDVTLAMLAEFTRRNEAMEPTRDRPLSVQEQLFPLLLEERKLLQIHGTKHPEVIAVRDRIAYARKLMLLPPTSWRGSDPGAGELSNDPVGLYMDLLKQKIEHLKRAEDTLASVFQAEQDEARRLAVYEIQNDSFRTGLAMNQQMYEALVKRFNEVSLIRDVGGYQIELIEPPSLGRRAGPGLAALLGAGAVLGLVLGSIAAYAAEARQTRSAMQVGKAVAVTVPTATSYPPRNGSASPVGTIENSPPL